MVASPLLGDRKNYCPWYKTFLSPWRYCSSAFFIDGNFFLFLMDFATIGIVVAPIGIVQ